MDKKDLEKEGFGHENINNLFAVKAREEARKIRNQIEGKRALGITGFISGYEYDHAVPAALSPEDALSEFDQHVNPFPQTERPSEEVVHNQARKILLEGYNLMFLPISPYPLINIDWQEASVPNMYVRYIPILSKKNRDLYLVQVIEKGKDEMYIHERLAITTRPETLQVLVSQLTGPSSAR